MNKMPILFFSIFIYLTASLGLYFLAANDTTAHLDIDSTGYDKIGKYFSKTALLCDPTIPEQIPVTAQGYSLFLGIIYKIFGYSYLKVIIVQILLSLFACFLLYRIASLIFDEITATVTVILFSINLGFLVYCQFLLTEILLSTLLIFGLERLITYFSTNNIYPLMQSGLIYGISVIVKPVALFYIAILLFFISLFLYKHSLNIFKYTILFCLCFYLPVAGYVLHNRIMFNTLMVAPAMNENLYNYFLPKVIMHIEHKSKEEALKKIVKTYEKRNNNDPAKWIKARELLIEFAKKNPIQVSYIWLNNVFKTFFGLYSSQLKFLINPTLKQTETSFFSKKGSFLNRLHAYLTDGTDNFLIHFIAYVHFILATIQYVLVIIASIILLLEKRYFLFYFILLSIFYFAFITGHEGFARYRMMFEYFFILLAAFAIVFLYRWFSKNEALSGLKAIVSREILRSQPYYAKATKGSTCPSSPVLKNMEYSSEVE